MIDPNYCTKLRYDGDVAQALNKDKQFIKHTFFPDRSETRIVVYRNKEYGLGVNTINDPSTNTQYADFWIADLLEVQQWWKEQGFIGEWVAEIKFELKNSK